MNTRYVSLIALLAALGCEFFAINRSHGLHPYIVAAIFINVTACTLTLFALAINSLRSMSILIITRSATVPIAVVLCSIHPSALVRYSLGISSLMLLCFFSEQFLSLCIRDVGSHNNEQTYILRLPRFVAGWYTFTWAVTWATLMESIHLFKTHHAIVAFVSLFVGAAITLLFIRSQLRIFSRRCVIVPHGVVVSDSIAMSDVVLLPLAKIVDVIRIPNVSFDALISKNVFAPITSKKNVVGITLTESTDSLIIRKSVAETERVNVDTLLLSIADARGFVSMFKKRFHKVEAPELTRNQEKMVEKQLGIETAPRSDEKLPQWRKKKKPKNDESASDDS